MLQYTRPNPPGSGNSNPIVNAGADKTITLPTNSVGLVATASDPGGSIAARAWTKTAGPTQFTFSNTSVLNPTVSNLVAGTYTFRLTVTDNQGATAFDEVRVIVNSAPVNTPPVVSAGSDKTITLPVDSIRLIATASDPGGSVASTTWTKTAGPTPYAFSSSTVLSPTVKNLAVGTYTFRLTVVDNQGASAFDDVNVIVKSATVPVNTPPVANAGTDKTIILPVNSIQLVATASDPGGSVASTAWTKTAGPAQYSFSSTTVLNPTISNLVAGTYTFRITAVDNLGATGFDDVNVIVEPETTTPPTGGKTIRVNVFGGANAYNNAEWNNWNVGVGGVTNSNSAVFKYTDGTTSTVKAVLSQSTGIGDNLATYTGGMAPAEVLRYTSYSTMARTLTISGLAPSKVYGFEFYASRGANGNNKTVFSSGTKRDTANTDHNHTDKAILSLSSDNTGKIVIAINRTNIYTYLNGFMISESGSAVQGKGVEATVEPDVVSTIQVFPNPFQDRIVLNVNNDHKGTMKVQLYDMSGSLKKEFTASKNLSGSTQTYLSSGNLPAGEYILKVSIGNWTESIKISRL
jgi:hypothetical protein